MLTGSVNPGLVFSVAVDAGDGWPGATLVCSLVECSSAQACWNRPQRMQD